MYLMLSWTLWSLRPSYDCMWKVTCGKNIWCERQKNSLLVNAQSTLSHHPTIRKSNMQAVSLVTLMLCLWAASMTAGTRSSLGSPWSSPTPGGYQDRISTPVKEGQRLVRVELWTFSVLIWLKCVTSLKKMATVYHQVSRRRCTCVSCKFILVTVCVCFPLC